MYQQSMQKLSCPWKFIWLLCYACICGLSTIYIFFSFFVAENNVGPSRSRSGTLSAEGQVWGKNGKLLFFHKKKTVQKTDLLLFSWKLAYAVVVVGVWCVKIYVRCKCAKISFVFKAKIPSFPITRLIFWKRTFTSVLALKKLHF